MESICVNFLDPVQFVRFLKGCCRAIIEKEINASKIYSPVKVADRAKKHQQNL